jgi:toxin-antitoxin system PIN domain toxin
LTLLDANVLLYAYDKDAPNHLAAARWIKHLFDGSETIGLPWITLWAFVRISTNPRVWTNPKPPQEAFQIVREWLALPGVVVVQPGPRHVELLERLVIDNRAAGPLTTDAALAAMAIEHGATLASTDRDFSRFPDLRWVNPIP